MKTQRVRLPVVDPRVETVTAVLQRPDDISGPPVLLTHGAGGDLDAEGLVALGDVIAGLGSVVVRANLPYREGGRRGAPRAESSVAPFVSLWQSADALLRERDLVRAGTPWVLGGKSYGGRVASLALADDPADGSARPAAAGLLFYGYPLHPPGKPEKLRVAHWPRIGVPCLFLQGDRDPFSTGDLLEQHLTKLPRRATLEIVQGGDHSLRVTGAASPDGRPRSAVAAIRDRAGAVDEWLRSL
ncbi:MAG: dienelactone hydrolase [Actinobacteria bacterium]|jgi:predicted alpha/beta-hydrolase family hydrolase|nr:dienelactone hydrolase [Actinomycetota bacterium]